MEKIERNFEFHPDLDISKSQLKMLDKEERLREVEKDLQANLSHRTRMKLFREKVSLESYINAGL